MEENGLVTRIRNLFFNSHTYRSSPSNRASSYVKEVKEALSEIKEKDFDAYSHLPSYLKRLVDQEPNVFSIEKTKEHYVLHNLEHLGAPYVFKLSRELLNGGKYLSQSRWAEWTADKEEKLITLEEYVSMISALEKNKDHSVKRQKKLVYELRDLLKTDFRKRWMMTGTRGIYHPDGSGKIIHGVDKEDKRVIEVSQLAGPNGYFDELDIPKEITRALFGIDDIGGVIESLTWLGDKKPYLWRLNNVQQEAQRALGLGLNAGRFSVDAGYFFDVDDGRSARGVAIRRAAAHANEVSVMPT